MDSTKRPSRPDLPVQSPDYPEAKTTSDAAEAVAELQALYTISTGFLRTHFRQALEGELPTHRFRAFYPEIHFSTTSHAKIDSRLAYGHVAGPGDYHTTVTRPDARQSNVLHKWMKGGCSKSNAPQQASPRRCSTASTVIPRSSSMKRPSCMGLPI